MTAGAKGGSGTALPEFLSRDDRENGSWQVEAGTPTRGDAWTDMTNRRMRVPVGGGDETRVIRLHEMMHAKVSPADMTPLAEYRPSLSTDMVIAAEEARVNLLVGETGADIDLLVDGSEKMSGERIGKAGMEAWNKIVEIVLATSHTKACSDFLRGVAKSDPEMAKEARKVHSKIKTWHRKWARKHPSTARYMANTKPVPSWGDLPHGFVTYTVPLAEYVSQFLLIEAGDEDDMDEGDETALERVERQNKAGQSGQFAKMILKDLPLPNRVNGRIGRKRVASHTGKNPRRMNRMLTDPQQRVFDRRVRGKGGIVLIDQSGSMSLTHDDIWKMIEHAPACVIIGYSHASGSTTTPNVWKIADRGRVCDKEDLPSGNGGNGVDGPALRYALKHRRNNEPVIWVCDGVVTDGQFDQMNAALDVECARLVVKHGIHTVYDTDEAIKALERAERGERLPMQGQGPVANAIRSVMRH